MSNDNSRFTSDRRPLDRASWSETEDWEAGVAENLDIGDGDLVAQRLTTIGEAPDAVVDNFETGDLSRYDTNSGGNFSVTPNQVINGAYSLEADFEYDTPNQKNIISVSGLANYPKKGDTFSFWYRANSSHGEKPRVFFNYIDGDNYYMIGINRSNGGPNYYKVRLFRVGGGSSEMICTTGGNGSWKGNANTWYEFEIVWTTDDVFELYIRDTDGAVEVSATGSDSSPLPPAEGIGFNASGDSAYGASTTKIWFDNFQIKDRAG
jgi:hypothetical protein